MSLDAIIDEVRAIRDAIAREHDYDLDSIFRMLRECERKSGVPHVTLSPKRLDQPASPEHATQQGAAADGASRRG